MPQIVVRALTRGGVGAVTLAERAVPAEQQNDHYIAQLIERVRWALTDAEQIESEANVEDQDEPMLAALPVRKGSAPGRAPVATRHRGRPRPVGEVGDGEVSLELVDTLRAALDNGCSLAELEATLLARSETSDQVDAAWLYAWAYDAIRPQRDNLAARLTNRPTRGQTPKRREALDAAIDQLGVRSAHRALVRPARPQRWLELIPRSSRCPTPAANRALNNCAASDAATERLEVE